MAAEAARQEQQHMEAAQSQQETQRAKRVKVYDQHAPCHEDEYKCPQCFFRNFYLRDACNKLSCGNCGTSFCVKCGKPATASCRCIAAGWARF